MNVIKLTFIALVLSLCGCSASGPKFSQAEYSSLDQPQIHVYRRYNIAGIIASPIVYVDNVKQGKLKAGGFISIPVAPGEHEVVVGALGKDRPNWGPGNMSLKIRAAAGDTIYLKLSNHVTEVRLSAVDEPAALKELSKTKRSN